MSCSFKAVGNIAELDKILECLDISEQPEADGVLPHDTLCAISPVTDLLVLVRHQNICVLVSDCITDEEDRKFQFHMSWTRNICQNKETITAVLVLPVTSSTHGRSAKSPAAGPDWTCIVLGFSSGFIRFYNEVGDVLLSHRLHNEPLTDLRSQSHTLGRHSSEPEQLEEVHALFPSVVCVLPGFPLFSTLKAVRSHSARVVSDGSDPGSCVDVPLKFNKYRFTDQHSVSSCAVVGAAATNMFDHLVTASVCGGFNASYKSSAPQSTQIIATGTKPYVGFHYAMEGSSHQILTDVAKVVANKLKSAIGQAVPSWFMGGSKSTAPPEEAASVQPAEDTGCRFGLCDAWRQGIDVLLSPLRTTCIVTDMLGRMTLVDTLSGVAVRQWKGYREAQTGWLTVEEDSGRGKSPKRSALFLVVYAPKRALLEVWAMQQGPRIASFSPSRPGRLLYTRHGLMGGAGTRRVRHAPLLFLRDDGVISELDVPFHCALTEENSSSARDLHLLKKLRCAIRDNVHSESKLLEEANEVADNLRTVAAIRDALGTLTRASHITPVVLASFLTRVRDTLSGAEDVPLGASELLAAVAKLQSLTQFYEYICAIHDVPPDYACVVGSGDSCELEDLSKKLSISPKELTRVSNLITSAIATTSPGKKRVKFSSNFIDYIQIFDIFGGQSKKLNVKPKEKRDILTPEDKVDDKIHIDPSASRECLSSVSSVMFQGVVYGSCSLTDFTERCKASNIGAEDLVRLALLYWSNKEHGSNIYKEMIHFSNVLKYVCILKECCDAAWWQSVRSQLSECVNPLSAMTAALICRGVAIQWEKNGDRSAAESEDDVDWETYDQSSCQWSLLIGQLEDISILDRSTRSCVVLSESALPWEPCHVTLEYVLQQGRGCVTEVVARWLCACGLRPELVVSRRDAEFMSGTSPGPADQKNRITGVAEGVKPVIEESVEATPMSQDEARVSSTLSCLKQHFPFSLSCSRVLVHMCWEYARAYENSAHRLELLRMSLECLEHIQSSHIKQGMCYLLWSQHLRPRFECCLRLLHKVGKLPKDLLCKQDLKLSHTQLAPFLTLFVTFFEQYIQASIRSETCERPRVQYEPFWEGQTRQSPTFVQLCLTQPPASYETLHLLLQATHAFCIMVAFNLKVSKPLNAFFDSTSQAALFADLHAKALPVRIHPDARLVDTRRKFLVKALTSSVQLVSTDLNPDGEPVYDVTRCAGSVSRIMELAAEWSVPTDLLRRHQVCELYASGYDQLAREITPLVSETSLLGSQLLLILGLRMKLLLQSTKNTELKNTLSCLSPSVISWLDSLKLAEEMKIESTRLSTVAEFSQTIVRLLPEDHADRHMATLLADCLPQLVHNDAAR